MKTLNKPRKELQRAGRWDIDFHLPPEGIRRFPPKIMKRVDEVADIGKDKRDPTKTQEKKFQYIDISCVDVSSGVIVNPQELTGSEAPSRARKVVRAFDIIISTCRPTRGAISVVPTFLHDQIASTGFSIVRAHEDVNPYYLHYALRLRSTLEQFRKWSTGSSYPAILDEDVAKTLIPVPEKNTQDAIAKELVAALKERDKAIRLANATWKTTIKGITAALRGEEVEDDVEDNEVEQKVIPCLIEEIRAVLKELPPLTADENRRGNGNNYDENEDLFDNVE